MSLWQSQGVMAPSPVPDVPARYYTPPMIYPPQPPVQQNGAVPGSEPQLSSPLLQAPGTPMRVGAHGNLSRPSDTTVYNGAVYRVQRPKVLPLPPDDFS
jgi:hypothetical protein